MLDSRREAFEEGFGGRFEITPLEPSENRAEPPSQPPRGKSGREEIQAPESVPRHEQREERGGMAWRRSLAGAGAASAAFAGAAYYYRPDPSGELLESRRTKSPRVRGVLGGCEVVTCNKRVALVLLLELSRTAHAPQVLGRRMVDFQSRQSKQQRGDEWLYTSKRVHKLRGFAMSKAFCQQSPIRR